MSQSTRVDATANFSAQVSAVGGHFASVPTLTQASEYIGDLASVSGAKRVVVFPPELASLLFTGRPSLPFVVASSANMTRESFFEALQSAQIGVSPAHLGIAETGTLVIVTSEESHRLVTALPETHVAILPRSKLVASLDQAQQYVSESLTNNPGAITISLISASSRTSDVGGISIVGVHGPKELHVLLLDEELPGAP